MSTSLWSEACSVLRWHNKGADTCIQTLNRLWRKSPWVTDPQALPLICEQDLQLSEEIWELAKFESLLHERQRTDNTPRAVDPPIIAVRWLGRDYLIDGRTRINFWLRTEPNHQHRVIVIHAI